MADARTVALIRFLRGAGCRLIEAFALQTPHVHLDTAEAREKFVEKHP